MNCQEVMELMHRQLDDDLSDDELIVLMNHTRQCPECAATFERLTRLSAELASLPKVTPKYSLVDAILPELERIELQSKQAGFIQTPAASLSPDEQSIASRRLQPKRRWPSWSAAGSVVAAGIVAGFFLLNAPSDFGSKSNNQAAEFSAGMSNQKMADSAESSARSAPLAADEGSGSAGGDIPLDELRFKTFIPETTDADVADGGKAQEGDDSVTDNQFESIPAGKPAEAPELTGDSVSGAQGGGVTPTTGETEVDPASGGELKTQDQHDITQDPSYGIAEFTEIQSPDGLYIAKVEEFSVIIVSSESGETLMETPRKNGQHGQLVWSEDGAELFYDVQLDQGAIEKYVIQTSNWSETKAPH
jgi:hypothetical protein